MGCGSLFEKETHKLEKEISGVNPHTTNNQMELTAVVEA